MTSGELPAVGLDAFLAAVAADLAPGQMLHSEGFSLFEAMSAIEIGDPKMDAGLHPVEVRVDELLGGEASPETLSATLLLGVFMRLMQCEATWFGGHPLSQTVATCLYILRVDRAKHSPLLHAYASAVKLTVQLVRSITINGLVVHDEDFLPHTSGLPFETLTLSLQNHCVAELGAMEETLLARLSSKALSLGCLRLKERCQVGPVTLSTDETAACLAHLGFRRAMILGLDSLRRVSAEGVQRAKQYLQEAAAHLEKLEGFQHLAATQVPGFHPDVNRSSAASVPPRALEIQEPDQALANLRGLLSSLQAVCNITSVGSLPQLRTFLERFAAQRPGPVASSALHLVLTKMAEGGKAQPFQPSWVMLLEDMGLGAAPAPLPVALCTFVDQAVATVKVWVRAMCSSRCFQRRKLRRTVEDWAILYQSARALDESGISQKLLVECGGYWEDLQPPGTTGGCPGPMSLWVEIESSRSMLSHFLLGWELELYCPEDYCMIYWYCDYLFSSIATGLQVSLETRPSRQHGKRKQKGESSAEDKRAMQDRLEVHICNTKARLCQAMIRMSIGLQMAGLLPRGSQLFNGEEQRFEQRFSFLRMLERPEPLWHPQYQQAIEPGDNTAGDLFQMAQMAFSQVATTADAFTAQEEGATAADSHLQAEVLALKRVTMQNHVALKLLQSLGTATESRTVSWDFTHHPHFPVAGLKAAKKKQQQ